MYKRPRCRLLEVCHRLKPLRPRSILPIHSTFLVVWFLVVGVLLLIIMFLFYFIFIYSNLYLIYKYFSWSNPCMLILCLRCQIYLIGQCIVICVIGIYVRIAQCKLVLNKFDHSLELYILKFHNITKKLFGILVI